MSEKCLLLWDFARRVHDFNKDKFLPDAFENPVKSPKMQLLKSLQLWGESKS